MTAVRRKKDCVIAPGVALRAGSEDDGSRDATGDEGRAVRLSDDLDRLDADLLRRRWRSVIGRPAPASLSRSLMIRILSWREQIAGAGDLDSETLAALAAALTPERPLAGGARGPTPSRRPRPGTVLVREHRGALHRVMVLEAGYAWNGKTFPSLSAVAVAITGTNWNGRRFFGLDHKRKQETIAPETREAGPPRVEASS